MSCFIKVLVNYEFITDDFTNSLIKIANRMPRFMEGMTIAQKNIPKNYF